MPSDPHVLIIGSGVTGLLAAQAFKKHGISYSIYEEAESAALHQRSGRDWSFGIHWGLPSLQYCLPEDLWNHLSEVQCVPGYMPPTDHQLKIYNAQTGEIHHQFSSGGARRWSRRKMREYVSQGIDIQYGKKLMDIVYGDDNTVTAHFKDGSSSTGSMILGADGPHSAVRTALLGAAGQAKPVGTMMHSVQLRFHDASKALLIRSIDPQHFITISQFNRFNFIGVLDASDAEKPENWEFMILFSTWNVGEEGLGDKALLQKIRDEAEKLAEPFKTILLWLPDDTKFSHGGLSFFVPKGWDNHWGRATLIGDAAHPMPPFRGQGLNNCILDVHRLVEQLREVKAGDKELKEAVDAYEEEMIPRTAAEVKASCEDGRGAHRLDRYSETHVYERGLRPAYEAKQAAA